MQDWDMFDPAMPDPTDTIRALVIKLKLMSGDENRITLKRLSILGLK